MTIKERLLIISNDIIPSMDLSFQKYLNERITISFDGPYPELFEYLVRIETLIPTIEIKSNEYSIWSEEYQKLAESNLPRKYYLSLNFVHQFCFNALSNYFDILRLGLFDSEANAKFDEYKFYLKLLVNHENKLFTVDYKRYWRELLLRIISVFESQETEFPSLFERKYHDRILKNLYDSLTHTPPRV